MYRWWVFVHLAAVFVFLASHGVSMGVAFRLRKERDPSRVVGLLELSSASIRVFYVSLVVLVAAGVVAGFLGHWWSQGWIWAAIVVLVLAMISMYQMASPYTRRVGFIARAMAGGSEAVTPEQFDEELRSPRPWTIAVVGVVALGAILYFMLFKPTFGFGSAAVPASSSDCSPQNPVNVTAKAIAFDTNCLAATAGKPFDIRFDNEDGGVPHNVAIYTTSAATKALFQGDVVTGPKVTAYHVDALQTGTYFFRCDVHPQQMTGQFKVR